MSFRISSLTAFVVVGDDDEEGVIGMMTDMGWMPFVCADQTRVDQMRPHAEEIAASTGKTIHIIRVSHREDIGVIEPPARKGSS